MLLFEFAPHRLAAVVRLPIFPTVPTQPLPATSVQTTLQVIAGRTPLLAEQFVFSIHDMLGTRKYLLQPRFGSFADLQVSVAGSAPTSIFEGGPTVLLGGQEYDSQSPGIQRSLLAASRIGQMVKTIFRWSKGTEEVEFTLNWIVRGHSLLVELSAPSDTIAAMSIGRHASKLYAEKVVRIPYLTTIPLLQRHEQPDSPASFISCFFDWTLSAASQLGPFSSEKQPPDAENSVGQQAIYLPRTDGRRNAVHEVAVLTISPNLEEVLPHLPAQPNLGMVNLRNRLVLSFPSETHASTILQLVEKLQRFDVKDLLIMKHGPHDSLILQKLGEKDRSNVAAATQNGPPNLADEVRKAGYLLALDEEYQGAAQTPDTQGRLALNSQGELQPVPMPLPHGRHFFLLKPEEAFRLAASTSAMIHDTYGSTATYLGEIPAYPPWYAVDYTWPLPIEESKQGVPTPLVEGGQMATGPSTPTPERRQVVSSPSLGAVNENPGAIPPAGMFHNTMVAYQHLLEKEREYGPTLGNGGDHFLWVGAIDGVDARLAGGAAAATLVDFDLLQIHPLMVNYGMGSYGEFFTVGKKSLSFPLSVEQYDQYCANEIAFGHAGYLPDPDHSRMSLQEMLREYFLIQPLQARYALAHVTSIRYADEDLMVPAGQALESGHTRRVHIVYDNGLEIYVNRSSSNWTVTYNNTTYTLPPFGWVAGAPDEFLDFSALQPDGHRVDYVANFGWTFFNPRNQLETFRQYTASRMTMFESPEVVKWSDPQ